MMNPMLYVCSTEGIKIKDDLLRFLPENRVTRIQKALKREKALQLYTSALLTGYVLNSYGKSLRDVMYDDMGKPYIEDGVNFNISHSAGGVIVAVGAGKVGADVQLKTGVSEAAARLFLGNDPDLELAEDIAYLWCRKEAFLKCLGTGWSLKTGEKPSVMKDTVCFGEEQYYITDYGVMDDYYISVCEKNGRDRFAVGEITGNELELFYRSA